MRMLQPRHRFRLDLKAQPVVRRGVFDGADHLQGDEAIGLELAGPIDDAHAAVAEDAEDLVAGHLGVFAALAWRQSRRNGPGVPQDGERRPNGLDGQGACLVHGAPRSERA